MTPRFLVLALAVAATPPCPEPQASPLSPEEALRTFRLAPGFRIELVAAEPLVQDPVAMTFDEDGRLWVVEMRGFMPNLDGRGEDAPTGRVSVLEDSDFDGRFDRGRVFLEGLVLPRAVAVVQGGALVADGRTLWFAQDTDGDGSADRRTVVDPEWSVGGNVEHQPNGLLRAIDNWIYNAKSRFRYRLIDGKWIREATEFRGQWGISQDDWGRLFYNYNWSPLHADVAPPGALLRNPHHTSAAGTNAALTNDLSVLPARPNTGVNRGYLPGVLDREGRLRQYASACSPLIYRGHQFPAEFAGNAFVCDPAANLVKRYVIEEKELELLAKPASGTSEFLASTDERFRPVFLADGPDGALYVVDMHRGVIQHRAFMTPHLRNEIAARGLDRPIRLGRIYRVVHTGRPPLPPMRRPPASLLDELSSASGWRRDLAQRLLVERGDRSVLPALHELALAGRHPLARLHALWTLEGLGEAEPRALADPHPRVQAAAIRILEKRGGPAAEIEKLLPRAAPEVGLQIALTLGSLRAPGWREALGRIAAEHSGSPIFRDAVMSGLGGFELEFLRSIWTGAAWQAESPGRALLVEALAGAVLRSGRPGEAEALLALLDGPDWEWRRRALLSGVALMARREPIRLAGAPAVLGRAAGIGDPAVRKRVESLGSLFEWPGHEVPRAAAKARPLTGPEERLFLQGRQHYLVACAPCHGPDGAGMTPLGPPLAGSEWVLGPPGRLVRIVLQGLEGPVHVNGTKYEPPRTLASMPGVRGFTDENLAAILTYIRRDWDHGADPVAPPAVSAVRVATMGRVEPWTEKELLEVK